MNKKENFKVFLRGLLMWTCDIIPWVSGWTIAFITWIYDKLIESLNAINVKNIKLMFSWNFKIARNNINWNFLLILFAGILLAILTLANIVSFLIAEYPMYISGFFLWLIWACAVVMLMWIQKNKWWFWLIIFLILWVGIWYFVSNLPAIDMWSGNLTMLVSWIIAIVAMILPWISGSYILLMLGQYTVLLGYVTALTWWNLSAIVPILFFCVWAVIWLVSFAKWLNYIKNRCHDKMVIVLTGIMLWSLSKLRPWRNTVETMIDTHGKEVPLVQQNVFPAINWEFWLVFLLIIIWFILIFGVHYFAKELESKK